MQISIAHCGMRAGRWLNQRPLVPSRHVPVSRTHIEFRGVPQLQLVCRTLARKRSAHVGTAAGRRMVYHNTLLPEPSLMMPASPLRRHDNAHSSVISRQHLMPARWQMHLLFKLLSDRRITAMQRHIACPRLCTRSTCECEAREKQLGGCYEDVDLGFFYILMGEGDAKRLAKRGTIRLSYSPWHGGEEGWHHVRQIIYNSARACNLSMTWDAHFDGHMDIHGFDPKDFADWILMMADCDVGKDDDDDDDDNADDEDIEDHNNNWLLSFQP